MWVDISVLDAHENLNGIEIVVQAGTSDENGDEDEEDEDEGDATETENGTNTTRENTTTRGRTMRCSV
jgi:hypothetical protein